MFRVPLANLRVRNRVPLAPHTYQPRATTAPSDSRNKLFFTSQYLFNNSFHSPSAAHRNLPLQTHSTYPTRRSCAAARTFFLRPQHGRQDQSSQSSSHVHIVRRKVHLGDTKNSNPHPVLSFAQQQPRRFRGPSYCARLYASGCWKSGLSNYHLTSSYYYFSVKRDVTRQ